MGQRARSAHIGGTQSVPTIGTRESDTPAAAALAPRLASVIYVNFARYVCGGDYAQRA